MFEDEELHDQNDGFPDPAETVDLQVIAGRASNVSRVWLAAYTDMGMGASTPCKPASMPTIRSTGNWGLSPRWAGV